jgi:hypothetical protein
LQCHVCLISVLCLYDKLTHIADNNLLGVPSAFHAQSVQESTLSVLRAVYNK